MTIEEQKKAVRSGYDMDIIPTDLATYGEEAKICKKETAPEWSPTRNVFPSFEKDSPDGEMKSLVERPVLGRSDHWNVWNFSS